MANFYVPFRGTALAFVLLVAAASSAQTAKTYTTQANGTQRLAEATATLTTTRPSSNILTLHPGTTRQTMDGFGYALTYSTCYNLLKMSKADRTAFLMKTFSPTAGYGASYVRMSIGCSDFSSKEYSLCDTKGIENFALQDDEVKYVIPVLKEVLAINPTLKVIAAPWTCPRWMKVTDLTLKLPWYSWTDGHLNPDYYGDYAQYFVKFIQAMKNEGISIYAVSPQNEPLNKGNCASLYMPWSEEAAFLKQLAPAFKAAGLTTKIYVFDHNYNYDDVSSQNDYPIQVYNALAGSSFEGSELIVGAAYHDYGGSSDELNDIHSQNTSKQLMFSETSIGTWNDGRNLNGTLVNMMKNVVLGTVNKWCNSVLVWNLMLDTNLGPNLDGGCQTCYGAVDIDPSNYSTLSYNSHYYIISHIASVVKPGAVFVYTTGSLPSGIESSAYKNPDGSYGVVFASSNGSDQQVTVYDGNNSYVPVKVPANSIVSLRFSVTATPSVITFDGKAMTARSDDANVYELTTTLQQGSNYQAAGSDVFSTDGFYYDPDFFTKNADGTFQFKALSGSYKVVLDLSESCFRVMAMNGSEPATLQADGTGAVWAIGSDGLHKPFYSMIEGEGWWTDTDHDICLAQVSDKVYQMTLTVGSQLKASDVNFKFFGQPGWNPELKGSSSTYHISTESTLFGIGTGSDGHDDGNVYLKDGVTLTAGDTYVFTVDLTKGVGNAVLKVSRAADYAGIWVIGAPGSIGFPNYTSGTAWNPDDAIAMTKGDATHYYIDFTVGKQLNKDTVNFKFFGQAGWGVEFTADGDHQITSTSSQFLIGNGNGHDNGNIYLADGSTLTDGDTYRFSLDVTDPYHVVLTVTKMNDTGINAVTAEQSDNNYYTPQGIKVKNPKQRSVYIHHGRKVIVK